MMMMRTERTFLGFYRRLWIATTGFATHRSPLFSGCGRFMKGEGGARFPSLCFLLVQTADIRAQVGQEIKLLLWRGWSKLGADGGARIRRAPHVDSPVLLITAWRPLPVPCR